MTISKRFWTQAFNRLALRGMTARAVALCGGALLLNGCAALKGPELEPTPTPANTPKPDIFDANDGITSDPLKVTKLNDPANPVLPTKFRVQPMNPALAGEPGELVLIQTSKTIKTGNPPIDRVILGTPDVARLAGIIMPPPAQAGYPEATLKLLDWTQGQDVDVEQDSRYPVDLASRRMVQIYFLGREGKTKDVRLNLNRMMVRLGYALVDIHAPTSLDIKPWLNDEQFARNHKLGLWGKDIPFIRSAHRLPAPLAAPKPRAQKVTLSTSRQVKKSAAKSAPAVTSPAAPARPAPAAALPPPPAPASGGGAPPAPGAAPPPGAPPAPAAPPAP